MNIFIKKTEISKRKLGRIHTAGKTKQVKEFGYPVSRPMTRTDAKCQMEIKRRIVTGEETFSKRKELLRRKLDRNQKKRMIKTNAIECHAVGITDMGYEKRRYKKTGCLSNVN